MGAENPMESSWLLVSLCLIGATCNAHKDPLNPDLVSGTDVFVSGTENYPTFRIPAALRLANGELLMFAEGRHGGDHGWNDIVMKRSSDDGETWSQLQKVYGESNSTHSVTIGNPSPIALHTAPGHIVLVACRENHEVLTVSSTDYGHTWSKATYITEQVTMKNWTWVATGPPQGLQLEGGRLFIAADHYAGTGSDWGSHSMYSDDLGTTWQISASIDGGNECQAARAPNGSLVMNMRTRGGVRQFAWSDDDGSTWSAPVTSPFNDLRYGGGGCEGSTVALPSALDAPASSKLVFSTPFSQGRKNMTLFVSEDSGASWEISQNVYSGESAYSALVPLNSTHVGLAYEKDGYKTINYQVLKV